MWEAGGRSCFMAWLFNDRPFLLCTAYCAGLGKVLEGLMDEFV